MLVVCPGRGSTSLHKQNDRATGARGAASGEQRAHLNIQVQPPRHDDELWLNLPEEVRNDVLACEAIQFPDLRALCKKTLDDIAQKRIPGSDSLPYHEFIESHGGPNAVSDDLVSLVRPEIKGLQGRKVDRAAFDSIMAQQRHACSWTGPSGYVDYITDSRRPDYVRTYVGQCRENNRRLLRQHAQCMLQGSFETLHYYILWLGNGFRTANFLQLWEFPAGQELSNWYEIKANILEAVFCRALCSHHGSLENADRESANSIGLNIMTTLIHHGTKPSQSMTIQCMNGLRKSPDVQIRHWSDFRAATKKEQPLNFSAPPPLFQRDFLRSLEQALENVGSSAVESYIRRTALKVDSSTSIVAPEACYGSLQAQVGFVLDYAAASPADCSSPVVPDEKFEIPWSLKGCGFTSSNVLVWTHDFQPFSTLQPSDLTIKPNSAPDDRQRHFIDASQLKVVLLCGSRAVRAATSTLADLKRVNLELRGMKFPFARLSEAIKFAAFVAGLSGIRSYFIESSTAVGSILRSLRAERVGHATLTTQTMDDSVRLWLGRKGLGDSKDVEKLEEIAGSLSRGLLMLLHVLPRAPIEKKSPAAPQKQNRRPGPKPEQQPHDPQAFHAVKAFVGERITLREAGIRQHHASLVGEDPVSTDVAESTRESEPDHDSPDEIESLLSFDQEDAEELADIHMLLHERSSFHASPQVQDDMLNASVDYRCEASVSDLRHSIQTAVKNASRELESEEASRNGVRTGDPTISAQANFIFRVLVGDGVPPETARKITRSTGRRDSRWDSISEALRDWIVAQKGLTIDGVGISSTKQLLHAYSTLASMPGTTPSP
ncbi:hypothetical protein KJ359_010153 [Pestalotiopsis sp. 9143b]|nr:hypothetical protein KJ359_010153 [Pestalotiopsis sp. 9143b]